MSGGNFDGASFDGSIGGFDVDGGAVENEIRNYSLREWRRWKREDLEKGELPEDLREQADAAIAEADAAARALARKQIDAREALLRAMEAREAFEAAYREAYEGAFVAEIVARLWREDMEAARRRRVAVMLLLL